MNFDDDDGDFRPEDRKKKSRERGGKEGFDPNAEPPPSFGERPPRRDFGGGGGGNFGDRPPRRDFGGGGGGNFGDRPPRRDFGGGGGGNFGDRPPRRDFGGGGGGGSYGDRPPRRDFGGGGGGSYGDRPPRRDFGDRPPRRDFGGGGNEQNANLETINGVVKFFNGERGFGFVSPEGGGADVFVHISAVQRAGLEALEPNQKITFQMLPDKFGKGPKAINIGLVAENGEPDSAEAEE